MQQENQANRNQPNRRGAQRHPVNLPSEIIWNGESVACELVDVSSSGALVSTEAGARPGDQVRMIGPAGLETLGKVVRVTARHVALSFPGAVLIAPVLEQAAVSG